MNKEEEEGVRRYLESLPPITEQDRRETDAAMAGLNRAMSSFGASVGTVQLLEQATDEISETVTKGGLSEESLRLLEGAHGRLGEAIEFARRMHGGVA